LEDALIQTLKDTWGYDSFRPIQREAVECVLEHRDSVVVLPTGGGKSLCFQLPALLMDGMAVVVSPLIALMKDQVDALRGMGVNAAAINSMITESERQAIAAGIRQRQIKLLYVTPERLVQERFITYLRNNHLSFVAVDEAHCISQWGHDFRPEFRGLGILRDAFPETGIHAYTATATPQVRDDIALQLRLRRAVFHTGAFDRPNLIYRVLPRQNELAQVTEVLQRHEGDSGIIYCLRRKDVDELCNVLRARGHRALPYHAGMDNESRKRNQEAFLRDEASIIVATVAFGMGIDKPDVRFVLHMGMPKSIEHYQQESGRAGRDGLQSECVLLHGGSDYRMWMSFAEKSEGEAAATSIAKLRQMMDYCTGSTCRHAALTRYFGERMRVDRCVSCDVCLGEVESMEDSPSIARVLLEAVQQCGERYGVMHLCRVLAGERDDRIEAYGHTGLSAFGAMRGTKLPALRQWYEQLAEQRFVEVEPQWRTLQLTPDGRAFLHGGSAQPPRLSGGHSSTMATRETRRRTEPVLMKSPEEKALFQSLRDLRMEIAREEGVPPYIIFGDRTLVAMAVARPCTLEDFARVHGVGSIKHEKYGARFVEHVQAFCDTHGLGAGRPPLPEAQDDEDYPRGQSAKREDRRLRALEMLRNGATLEEAAVELGRAVSTVCNYLAQSIEAGEIDDISPWVSEAEQERIAAVARELGLTRRSPIHQALDGEVSYETIRIVLAMLQREASRA
jgi:ATP-dependent DNA helicase RecQ